MLQTPFNNLLQDLSGLGSPHVQKHLPTDVVDIVLEDGPISAIDALDQDQRTIAADHLLHNYLVGFSGEVETGVVVNGFKSFEAKTMSSLADVGFSSKCLRTMRPSSAVVTFLSKVNLKSINLGHKLFEIYLVHQLILCFIGPKCLPDTVLKLL